MVDLNGNALVLPLKHSRAIVYRVWKIRRVEERGELFVLHYLELVPERELRSLV